MKTLHKRAIVLVMSLTMILSYATVASAADISVNNSYNAFSTELPGSNFVNSTRDLTALSNVIQVAGPTAGHVEEGNLFYMNTPAYITITLGSSSPACTVKLSGSVNCEKYIGAGGGAFTIGRGSGRIHYTVTYHASSPASAFQFFATDNQYGR